VEEEKKELLDRMITWIKYHDIKSLIEMVLQAIYSVDSPKQC